MPPSADEDVQSTSGSSKYTTDPILTPFLDPSFDPAIYLNAALPALTPQAGSKHTTASQAQTSPPSISELSNEIQNLLSQLTIQNARLSGVLTQLTDDILRSGGRLSYEVDVLRGETRGLVELLLERIGSDLSNFVSGQLVLSEGSVAELLAEASLNGVSGLNSEPVLKEKQSSEPEAPPYIQELQMLTMVRNRLEKVTKVFGEAMEWVLPPSETSFASSFISLSAPEPGPENHSQEEKGQEVTQALKGEIQSLLSSSPDPSEGIILARKRIEDLQELAMVWKGTIEEKPRQRIVDSLLKAVADKEKSLDVLANKSSGSNYTSGATDATAAETSRFGLGRTSLISQLQKIRDGL